MGFNSGFKRLILLYSGINFVPNFIYVIPDPVGNINSIANCVFYLTKKAINLKMAHNYSRNMSLKERVQEYTVIISLTELCLTVSDLHFLILYNTTGMSDPKDLDTVSVSLLLLVSLLFLQST